ncbi:MAG: hypothetical protein ACPHO6_02545 [Candidatus Latescibacterota bacterium]
MITRMILLLGSSLLIASTALEAEPAPSMLSDQGQHLLMGPIEWAAEEGETPAAERSVERAQKGGGTSPGRAFLYSIIVPGLGEMMNGSTLRGAVFMGIEAIGLGLYFNWNSKGKDLEKEFRQVADETWSPENYLAWRSSTISRNSSITHALPCSTYVNDYLTTGDFGDCPDSEVQQYYELIGKYDQYVSGWTDLVYAETGNPAGATQVDSVENYLSETRLAYEIQRDDSNRFLKRASAVTGLILVNHVISAIDAARVARLRSDGATAEAIERRTQFSFVLHQRQRTRVPMLMAYKPFP